MPNFVRDGQPLASAPEHTLRKAMQAFHKVTGMEFQAMGELEYYVIKANDPSFPATDQKGYHETAPFAKANDFRTRCMKLIAECGGRIKYGHSEVGNFTKDGLCYEQNEIEFLPVPADECACESFLTHDHTCRKAAFCAQEKIVGSRPPNRVRNCVTDLEKTDR